MKHLAGLGILLLVLAILSGWIVALFALGLVAVVAGIRRLDADIHAWDGLAIRFASE